MGFKDQEIVIMQIFARLEYCFNFRCCRFAFWLDMSNYAHVNPPRRRTCRHTFSSFSTRALWIKEDMNHLNLLLFYFRFKLTGNAHGSFIQLILIQDFVHSLILSPELHEFFSGSYLLPTNRMALYTHAIWHQAVYGSWFPAGTVRFTSTILLAVDA